MSKRTEDKSPAEKFCIHPDEEVIMYTKVKYSFDTRYSIGKILLSKASLQIIKNEKSVKRISILQIKGLSIDNDILTMTLEDSFTIHVKDLDLVKLSKAILLQYKQITYGVHDSTVGIECVNLIDDVVVKQRPKDAFRLRCFAFAYYYNVKSKKSFPLKHIDKYDKSDDKKKIQLNSMKPGKYAIAIGHAIGWERGLETVKFTNGFLPLGFVDMLNKIIQNTQTIKRIIFYGYSPNYEASIANIPTDRCSIYARTKLSITFNSCSERFIGFFASILMNISAYELVFTKINLSGAAMDFLKKSFLLSLLISSVERVKIEGFIIGREASTSFAQIYSTFKNCNYLQVRSNNIEQSERMVDSVLQSGVKACCLVFLDYNFKIPVSQNASIMNISVFNLANCSFTPSTLRAFFELLTSQPVEHHITLNISEMQSGPEGYSELEKIDFSNRYPNIGELVWDKNEIPDKYLKYFFAFLYTQKNLHMLSFNEVILEEPTNFLHHLFKLMHGIQLPGLTLKSDFDKDVFAQFLQSLSLLPSLEYLNIGNNAGGDEELKILESLVKNKNNKLCELGISGFPNRTTNGMTNLIEAVKSKGEKVQCLSISNLNDGKSRHIDIPKQFKPISDIKKRTNFQIKCRKENEHYTQKDYFSKLSNFLQ